MSILTLEQRSRLLALRAALDGLVEKIADRPAEINANVVAIRTWRPGAYNVGDVRLFLGIPYKCIQPHDSYDNPGWTPDVSPALWMQYHGTSLETARPWIQPTMAEDIYRAGEFMIWVDDCAYECLAETSFSPAEYSQVWRKRA